MRCELASFGSVAEPKAAIDTFAQAKSCHVFTHVRPELYMGIAPGSICSGTEERALCQIDSIKYISSRIDSGIFKVVPTH